MNPEGKAWIEMFKKWEAEEEMKKAALQDENPIIIQSGKIVSQYSYLMYNCMY